MGTENMGGGCRKENKGNNSGYKVMKVVTAHD